MSDLPPDRLESGPPFTNVGVDVFGPWSIVTRRTRGGSAHTKRWAVMFSCLTTRVVHIEPIEEMSSSALINTVRRFIAIRDEVKIFRSDRGTNLVGATDDLRIDALNVEDGELKDYLYKSGTIWIFNAPCSSHMGGAWERMIDSARRIVDAMLKKVMDKYLTHDVLATFMTEVSAIMNNRPLVPISTDDELPYTLTPATLLTQKTADAFYARSLGEFREGSFPCRVEKSRKLIGSLLETLERGIPHHSTETPEMDRRTRKFESWRCRVTERRIRKPMF